jgi:hypothetical protein
MKSNKELLLQSIKTVSGFLALLSIGFMAVAFILSTLPTWAGVLFVVLGTGGGLTWLEYKNLKDKAAYQRLKDGVK